MYNISNISNVSNISITSNISNAFDIFNTCNISNICYTDISTSKRRENLAAGRCSMAAESSTPGVEH